jgi:hypothetical protein
MERRRSLLTKDPTFLNGLETHFKRIIIELLHEHSLLSNSLAYHQSYPILLTLPVAAI